MVAQHLVLRSAHRGPAAVADRRQHCMSMSPAAPNRRRAVLIGIVALVVFGFVHAGILIADSDSSWSSWLTPFGFWVVAFLAYKFELDKHDDAA